MRGSHHARKLTAEFELQQTHLENHDTLKAGRGKERGRAGALLSEKEFRKKILK